MKIQAITLSIATVMFAVTMAEALAQNADFKGFPDVPKNHWAFQAVTDLARRGIVQGYPAEGSGDKLKAKPVAQAEAKRNIKTTPKRATKSR